MTAFAKSSRLVAIDALRGIAVLAVLLSHLPFSTSLAPGRSANAGVAFAPGIVSVLDYGRVGVHLFLVISGFCIHLQWAKARDPKRATSFVAFWKRRLYRLYPPYFVTLLLSLTGLFVLFHASSSSVAARFGYASDRQLVIDLIMLLLLMQNLTGASQRVGNGPFWTLALEEQLYFLYFVLQAMRRRHGWASTLVVVAAVTFGWRAAHLLFGHPPVAWLVVGPARWLEWVLGALAVEGYLGNVTLPAWTRSPAVLIAMLLPASFFGLPSATLMMFPCGEVLLMIQTIFGDALFGGVFFVLVNWSCAREGTASSLSKVVHALAFVGVWSYSLYLTHEPVLVVAKQIGMRAGLGVLGVTSLRLVLPLAVAYVFHLVIEQRFMRGQRT